MAAFDDDWLDVNSSAPAPPQGDDWIDASPAQPQATATAYPRGMVEPGTQNPFDYGKYPLHKNPDGSSSNVKTSSYNIDGKEVLLPTMVGGKDLRRVKPDYSIDDTAVIDHYKQTGEHFGVFDSPEAAQEFAAEVERAMQSEPAMQRTVTSRAAPQERDTALGELGKAVQSFYPAAEEIAGGAMQAFGETQQRLAREKRFGYAPPIIAPETAADVAKTGAELVESGQAGQQELVQNVPQWSPAGIAGNVVRSAPYMAAAAGTGILTRDPVAGAAVMGAASGAQEYGAARVKGRTPEEALQDAAFTSFAEGTPEVIPLGIAMKVGKPFLKRIVETITGEAGSEMVTEALHIAYETGELGQEVTVGQALDRIGYSGVVGAAMGAPLAAAGHVAQLGQAEDEVDVNARQEPTFDDESIIRQPAPAPMPELAAPTPANVPAGAMPAETLLGPAPDEVDVAPEAAQRAASQGPIARDLPAPPPPPPATPPLRDILADDRPLAEIQREHERALKAAQPPDGSPQSPVPALDDASLEPARARVESNPSEAQKAAGNYRKGHVDFQGLDVSIETPRGGERTGVGPDGKPWSVVLQHDYGQIKGTKAADGQPIDVIIGPDPASTKAFVIDQYSPETGIYDEPKAVMGVNSADEARAAYLSMFSDGKGEQRLGGLTETTVGGLKAVAARGIKAPIDFDPLDPRYRELGLAYVRAGKPLQTKQMAKALRITEGQAQRLLSHLATNPSSGVFQSRTGNFRRISRSEKPDDVLSFLARRGGVRDDEGHGLVKRRNLQRMIPQVGPFIRANGMSISEAGEALAEAGYFGQQIKTGMVDDAMVLNLIEESHSKPVYRPEDAGIVSKAEEAKIEESSRVAMEREIDRIAAEEGEDFSSSQVDEIVNMMQTQGLGAEAAVSAYADRLSREYADRLAEDTNDPDYEDIPFAAGPSEDGGVAGEGFEGPPGEAADETRGGEGGEAPEEGARPRPAEEAPLDQPTEYATEPGAVDAQGRPLPQTIIPGAERLSERESRRRAMLAETENKKRGKPGQKAVTGLGIFGGEPVADATAAPDQNDIFAEPKAEPTRNRAETETKPPQTEPPKPPAKPAPKTGIEDFGEVLQGARKHYAEAYRDRMNEAEGVDIAAEPLSKSWPEPDYDKLLEDGADPWAAAFVHSARDEIPTKPSTSWKLKGWVASVKSLRDFSNELLRGEVTKDQITAQLEKPEFGRLKRAILGRIELYQAVGHEKSLKGVTISAGSYSVYEGVRYEKPRVIYTVERPQKASAFSNMPRILAQGDTWNEAIADFKKKYAEMADDESGREVRFDIYSRRGDQAKKFIIGKKVGKEYVDLKSFDDVKAARAYLAEHKDELIKALERMKRIPNERKETNSPRVGIDHRSGADVAPEQFSETFGFRGVQFGNYVEGGRRQEDLNEAYDALMDMAGVLGIPARSLSLNGQLGLAFGARGHGGKLAAAAHYEPGTVVINLTKTRGAGSLAHEWWHALDNYFSRTRGDKDAYVTERPYERGPGIRPQMVMAFRSIADAIKSTGIGNRSNTLDRRRSSPYWSTGREMSARAYESYIIAKLQDQSASNDYLANIVSKEFWDAADSLGLNEVSGQGETYPYPTPAEVPAIRAAFDNFFKVIETKEEGGRAVLFQKFKTEPGALDAQGNPLPQTIIPGAERMSEREVERRKRLAEGKMQGKPGQKAVTGLGLFGGEAEATAEAKKKDQGTLFERGPMGTPRAPEGPRVKLSQDLIATLPERPSAKEVALFTEVDRIAKKIVPSARVNVARRLEAESVDSKKFSIAGANYTDGARRVIAWSLEAADAAGTLRHEAVHWLRDYLDDAEWHALVRAARNGGWIKKHDIDERYPGATYAEKIEESIAEEFGQWRRFKKAPLPESVRSLFERIAQFLSEVADMLRQRFGMNVTAADVFSRIASGKRGREVEEADKTGGGSAYLNREAKLQTAYHGSPHDFDEFSTEKMGTGEGAQAYGWGLYFAGKKEVAEFYKESLTNRKGNEFRLPNGKVMELWEIAGHVKNSLGLATVYGPNRILQDLGNGMSFAEIRKSSPKDWRPIIDQIEAENLTPLPRKTGRIYHVDLAPKDDEWLDWDKPMSQQSEKVRAALSKIEGGKVISAWKKNGAWDHVHGGTLYRQLSEELAPPEEAPSWTRAYTGFEGDKPASMALKAAGIPGIRYLDQGSRGGEGKGTHNFVVFDAKDVRVEAKFQKNLGGKDGKNSTAARQQLAQGFFAQGQPIERVIRIPFDIFGGVEKGEWKPGKYITAEARRIIRDAKFKDSGSFSFLNPVMANARAGLLDRYGLSQEYVERSKAVTLDKAKIEMKGADVLKGLAERNITAEEAEALQAILTGEKMPNAKWEKISEPIREEIDRLGAEAVHLGLVSAESYERNRGAYLHRAYLKHEGDTGALQGWVSQWLTNRRRRIIGDELKGRGMFMDVPKETLAKDMPGFMEAQRGAPVKGERVRMLDLFSETAGLPGVGEPKAKPIKRVFVAAGEPVPEKFKDYTDRGVWEVRQVKDGSYTLWRDYTKQERTKMGEILDARYNIGKTFALLANDLATGRFFKDIAENGDWTLNQAPNTKWVEAPEWRRHWQDTTIEWVKVPDSTIPKSGGKKRWGALAGKFVRAEIWRDLNEMDVMSRRNFWQTLLTQWKINKTARSPVVHMNNIISNVWLMDMADVRMQDLAAGVNAYVTESKDFLEAKEAGAFGSDMMSQEIKKNVLDPILKDLQKKAAGDFDGGQHSFGQITKLLDAIWSKLKAVDNAMVNAYRMEDEVFRMATYMRRRSLGDNPESAARVAREQFIDYDIRAPWVNVARNTVLPFIAYAYRAVPLIAKAMAHRPWKLAKYAMLAYAANALAYMLDPGDEDEERRSLRNEQQGYTWLGNPRMMRMPYRDQWGNPVFLDVRRWIPAGDVFDVTQGSSAIPIPAPLQFSGPMMLAAELMLNKQGFTGRPITNEMTDTPAEAAAKLGDWAWKAWVPGAAWVPGSWYWDRISLAARGATDISGTPYSVSSATLSSLGIKVQPQDVDLGFTYHALEFARVERELQTQARALGRAHERGMVSDATFSKEVASLTKKANELAARQAKTLLGDEAGQALRDLQAKKITEAEYKAVVAKAAARKDTNRAYTASRATSGPTRVPTPAAP